MNPFSDKFLSLFPASYCISVNTVLCNEISVKSTAELCGWDDAAFPPPLLLSWGDWEWQLRGFELALFSLPAILCRDGRQQVLLSVESRVTLWCCFGKKKRGLLCCQVAVVGRDSYGFVFPPRVTASAAPFAPLTGDPTPQPNGPHPGSNPCFSHMSMCVFAQALAVFAGPGQSDWLAQMWQA